MLFPYGDVTCPTIEGKRPKSSHAHRHGFPSKPDHRIAAWRCSLAYPERDAVRFGELRVGEVGVGPDDVVFADGHRVDLDLVGDALGVAGLEVEPEGAGRRRGREESGSDQEEQRGRSQPPRGRGSEAPRGHRRRSGGHGGGIRVLLVGRGKAMTRRCAGL